MIKNLNEINEKAKFVKITKVFMKVWYTVWKWHKKLSIINYDKKILITTLPHFFKFIIAKSEYIQEGIIYNQKFKDAKFKFEQDIVLIQKNYHISIYQKHLTNKIKN